VSLGIHAVLVLGVTVAVLETGSPAAEIGFVRCTFPDPIEGIASLPEASPAEDYLCYYALSQRKCPGIHPPCGIGRACQPGLWSEPGNFTTALRPRVDADRLLLLVCRCKDAPLPLRDNLCPRCLRPRVP